MPSLICLWAPSQRQLSSKSFPFPLLPPSFFSSPSFVFHFDHFFTIMAPSLCMPVFFFLNLPHSIIKPLPRTKIDLLCLTILRAVLSMTQRGLFGSHWQEVFFKHILRGIVNKSKCCLIVIYCGPSGSYVFADIELRHKNHCISLPFYEYTS